MQHQQSEETNTTSSLRHTGRTADEETPENGEPLRVTPEEVALAAAAWEARRDAEHAWRENTLPLEEAIHQLGLNATPQELAPEVAALRAAKARQEKTQRQTRHAAWSVGILGLVALIGALIAMGTLWSSLRQSRRALHSMTVLPLRKLASIPDNTPVHIDPDTLKQLAEGNVNPDNVLVDTRAENSDGAQSATMFQNEWTIIKSKGALLVSGWATAEFALDISNDNSGGIFSSRPPWLPANNLVPIQVPVYRLENQLFARYMPDGKEAASAATSALMAYDVTDSATAETALVEQDIVASADNFSATAATGWSHVDASLKNHVLHLTGNATTAELKKKAGEVAAQTLKRLHVSDTVSNEVEVADSE